MEQRDEHYYFLHQLMTSKLAGRISEEDDLYLNQIIEEDEEAQEMWKQINTLFARKDIETHFERHENRAWASIQEIMAPPRRRRRGIVKWRIGLAAAMLSAIVFCLYFVLRKSDPPAQLASTPTKSIKLRLANGAEIDFPVNRDSIQVGNALLNNHNNSLSYTTVGENKGFNTLIIPNGMNYHVVLSDGTEVWLNSSTRLQFPFNFSGPNREINISGEAYLKVAKNSKKPFIVHLSGAGIGGKSLSGNHNGSGASVVVLATEFNVNSYDSTMVKVALVQGAVKFKVPGGEIAIKPGIEAQYRAREGLTTVKFDEDDVLAWREGRHYLYESKLKEFSVELLRLYGIRAVIDDPGIGDRKLTGVMDRNKPVTQFLEYVKETMRVNYYFDEDSVLHFTSR